MHHHKPSSGPASWLPMLLGGLLLTAGVAAAAPVRPLGPAWSASYPNPVRFNEGADVAVDSDGNVYTVGRSVANRNTNLADLAVVKYNSSGRRLWVRTYPVPGGLAPGAQIALDGDDALVIAGATEDPNGITNLDYLVVKLDRTGDLVWDFTFNSINNGDDIPSSIAVDTLGDVYVSGTADTQGVFSKDALTFKLAGSDGDVLWQNRIEGQTTDSHFILDILVDEPDLNNEDDPLGGLYVTGRVFEQLDERDAGSFFTRRFDLATGEVIWDATYDGPGEGLDSAAALALTPDHGLVVTGRSVGLDDTADFTTIKYDRIDGSEVWVRRYSGASAGVDEAVDVAVDLQGNVYVTGLSQGTAARVFDYATVAYNGLTGAQLWAARYDGLGAETVENDRFDAPTALVVDAAGNITVTGRVATGGGRFAVGTLQYGPTGRQQWVHLYNGPGRSDLPTALALDPLGSLVIGGTSVTNSLNDDRSILTLKYLSNGRRPAAPPTFTFSESSRDRLVSRRVMGSQVFEEVTTHTFKVSSASALEEVDVSTFGPTTPFVINVGGFMFDATLADDPRYRAGRTSAVFTQNVVDEDMRTRKALTVTVHWSGGKLRAAVVGTAYSPDTIMANNYRDTPTRNITDTTTGTIILGSFTQVFDLDVTGRVTTRAVQQGAFALSTVTLSGKITDE